jgi:hypothetical protein
VAFSFDLVPPAADIRFGGFNKKNRVNCLEVTEQGQESNR